MEHPARGDRLMPRLLLALAAPALLAAWLLPPPASRGCASVGRERVAIDQEEALIVWDAKKKVQPFVRRASFRTRAKDFGFLVPTPSRPTLAAAPDKVFEALADITWKFADRSAGTGRVVVLEKRKVAGFDAA